MIVGMHFGAVFVRSSSIRRVIGALEQLMDESDRARTQERGLEPTPDDVTVEKIVRSFAVLPEEDDWISVLEDGHSLDDGGVAEGLSEILQTETLHFTYSDAQKAWSFTRYVDGQPLDAGGAEDRDYDVSAMQFLEQNSVPHFGVYYEEIAASAGPDAPALEGSLEILGDISIRPPMGTEIVTFRRRP
ncbi:MAG TPA: hypothetical protein VKT51_04075 [Candidatus Eremiobacteraceae bacterium]|nr:hypothetical protein [Candidatus Eremiobacteraceae bacterium]